MNTTATLRPRPALSDADVCRKNGWTVGTQLIGNEGYGDTVIQITAIGESLLLAKRISHNGVPKDEGEHTWTLSCRDWKRVG